MYIRDRFFTAVRVIDVTRAENLLMFGKKSHGTHARRRCSLNVYAAIKKLAELNPASERTLPLVYTAVRMRCSAVDPGTGDVMLVPPK